MKNCKSFIGLLLAVCMILCALPAAFADEGDETASRFAGKSWEDVISEFLAENDLDENTVTMGYCDLTTGEQHFFNGDKYMVSGSVYKVPLNMIFAEKIANGEMDLTTEIGGFQYSYALETTIIDSNNDVAKALWDSLGSYRNYRRAIAPYCGEDPDTVDAKFYENNFFTARQVIHYLTLLYNNPDRFPYIIDTMKRAEPKRYFARDEHRFEIAHKYGYYDENWHFYLNDSGIIYTDEPIALVMFTDNANTPYNALAKYCTLMCDYTQYIAGIHAQQRAEEEAAAQAKAEAQALEEAQRQARLELGLAMETPAPITAVPAEGDELPFQVEASNSLMTPAAKSLLTPLRVILCIVIFLACFVIMVGVVLSHVRHHRFSAILLALLANVLVLGIVFAFGLSHAAAAPEEDPQKTVKAFFSSISRGDYDTAYAQLTNYSDLNLDEMPNSLSAQTVLDALHSSWDCELRGDCIISGKTAIQPVKVTWLSVKKLENALIDVSVINDPTDQRTAGQKYTDFLNNLETLLEDPSGFLDSTTVNIMLYYSNGVWKMGLNDTLLTMLSGGLYKEG